MPTSRCNAQIAQRVAFGAFSAIFTWQQETSAANNLLPFSLNAILERSKRFAVSVRAVQGVEGERGVGGDTILVILLDWSLFCGILIAILFESGKVVDIIASSIFCFFITSFRANIVVGNISSCRLITSLSLTLSICAPSPRSKEMVARRAVAAFKDETLDSYRSPPNGISFVTPILQGTSSEFLHSKLNDSNTISLKIEADAWRNWEQPGPRASTTTRGSSTLLLLLNALLMRTSFFL